MFPTCSEVLEVIRALGYRQLSDEQIEELDLDQIVEPSEVESSEEEYEDEFADA